MTEARADLEIYGTNSAVDAFASVLESARDSSQEANEKSKIMLLTDPSKQLDSFQKFVEAQKSWNDTVRKELELVD